MNSSRNGLEARRGMLEFACQRWYFAPECVILYCFKKKILFETVSQSMLSDQSFLRNVPRVIDLESRLQWEVLVNASDAISFAYSQLANVLRKISEFADLSEAEPYRSLVSVYCWTIIDQTHAVFQILRGVDRIPNGATDTLLETFVPAISKMRNGMDHIHQNISNISKKKSAGYGIYGNFAFTTPIREDNTYSLFNFGLGGMQFNEQLGCTMDPQTIPLSDQIGNISFASFDTSINFSELFERLTRTINRLDISIQEQCTPRIADYTKRNNLNFEDVMKETIKGTVYINIQSKVEVN